MSDRATCWSVTINNPVASDEDRLGEARQKGWKVDGQLEKGENGTPHYQLIVRTPQVRFSAVKKAFPRAHIEVARNAVALASYVKKEETREGELPQTESKFPSLAGFYKLLVPVLFNIEDKHYRIDFAGGWYNKSVKIDAEQRLLDVLDIGTSALIRQGYHVETLVVNSQTRSVWKRFGLEIIDRTIAEMSADRQTDRQTKIISRPPSITKDAGEDASSQAESNSSQCSQEDDDDYDDDQLQADGSSVCSGQSGSSADCSSQSGD